MITSLIKRWVSALCSLLFATSVFAGHPGSVDLNPRQATPGLRLELQEIPYRPDIVFKRYRLVTSDYPRDTVYSVYTKNFADSFAVVAEGYRVDATGNLVSNNSGRPQRLQDLEFSPGPYPRGAGWNVAIASADHSIAVFARIIPHPLTAQSGGCLVFLEVLTLRGDRFLVTGSGFSPGEDVMTEASFDGRIEQKQKRISADGELPRHVISHAGTGTNRSARYTVRGRSCIVAVNYDWGEPALKRY
jgi:hypothetical protein